MNFLNPKGRDKKKIVEFSTKGGAGVSKVRFSAKKEEEKKHGHKTLNFAL